MTIRFACAASLLALAACQPPATETAKSAEPAVTPTLQETAGQLTGCNVSVEKPWIDQETPVRRYTAEATVTGPTCQQAAVLLVIRQREGTPIYTWSGQTDYLFGLREAADPAAMKEALSDWLYQGPEPDNTSTLPPWEQTDGQPKRAEFPFMPAEGIDKAAYEQLKKDKLDMFCFPQGMESQKCVVLRQGTDGAPPSMEEIGLQLFPG
ncbi:MAG: hypothetical protein QM773_04490 [Hyphomonadaceae bacterium]